ncbi:MAG: hypothetical protein DMG35_13745 [Acidobacteria bacterium]|nr:MAG: hypothetical protein DMG35_13745 [Acidobacteriota bacterium]
MTPQISLYLRLLRVIEVCTSSDVFNAPARLLLKDFMSERTIIDRSLALIPSFWSIDTDVP